jgi:hypothetical protein
LAAPRFFHDEAAAYAKLESILWANGPVCPKCGGMGRITKVKGGRLGLWRCVNAGEKMHRRAGVKMHHGGLAA